MHPDVYAYVVNCFKYIELMWSTNKGEQDQIFWSTYDDENHCHKRVLSVLEEAEANDMDYLYDYDDWTFDTCSPLQLRFSQRGNPGPHSKKSAPIWKCLVVDLLAEDLVVEDDPDECMVMLSMSNPEYRLLVLRSCVIAKKKQYTSIQLRSVYHYSGTRQRIIAASTRWPDILTSLCESFFFCPSCWNGTSAIYNVPNPWNESERPFVCSTSCEYCAQYWFGTERDQTSSQLKTQTIHNQRYYEPSESGSPTDEDSAN